MIIYWTDRVRQLQEMRFTFISDTHSLHDRLIVEAGDVLIHCGDLTNKGSLEDVEKFAGFMAAKILNIKL